MGRGFGFHRALDTLGAVFGIAVAAVVVYVILGTEQAITASSFHWLVGIGTVPAVLAVLLLLFFVHERKVERGVPHNGGSALVEPAFDKRFKAFLLVMVLFTLGNSATAFVVLRADDIGLSPFYILLLLVLFNTAHAAFSYPAGRLSDRIGRKRVILAGWGIYGLTYLGFALAGSTWHMVLLFALYGVYYGMIESTTRAFVADVVSSKRRGTAYGLYHGAIGVSLLLASVLAGVLWQWVSPSAPFFFGAAMAVIAIVAFGLFVSETASTGFRQNNLLD